jgi:hypothetical protein
MEQGFHFLPQFGVPAAGLVEKSLPAVFQFKRCIEQRLDVEPSIRAR